jgi:hypothetical protein
VDVRPVDPRDSENEWDASTYRVYFWSADGAACEEHELTGVRDVHEALAWSAAHAGDRVPEIFVRHDHSQEHGLIRIAGCRPSTR